MKTLLVTKEYPPFKGGVANYYYNLASHFPYHESFLILNNNKKELDSNFGFFSWRRAFERVYNEIKRNKINRVLVGHILPLGTVVYFLSFLLSFKYFVFLHGLDLSSALKTTRKRKISALILKRANKIICANSFVALSLLKEFPGLRGRVEIVNPGLPKDNPFVSEKEKENIVKKYNLEGKKVLLSLGRLVKRKGVDNTIKALEDLSDDELKDIVYFIVGDGPDKEYLKSLVSKKLKDKIIFLGEVKEELKWQLLSICDIFIMPARDIEGDYEGFGIVYLEANLFSKPVVAGRAGGVSDAVVDRLNGLLVDPENILEIKKAILKLKNHPKLRKELGERGRERAQKEFNWEKLALDLYKIIK